MYTAYNVAVENNLDSIPTRAMPLKESIGPNKMKHRYEAW